MQSMPRAKKIKKEKQVVEVKEKVLNKKYFKPIIIVGLVLVLLALLAWRNKGLFVAATVNGQPLWRLSIISRLDSQYGKQTLDELVGEMLIRQAAKQNKISVSKADLDAKIAEIEKSLNGQITLKDALAQQGDSLESFKKRVELQLLLEKLTAGQINISDQEVKDYIEKNKASLTATDEAGMTAEAKQTLIQTKQSQVLRQYFTDLQSKAKISKFL